MVDRDPKPKLDKRWTKDGQMVDKRWTGARLRRNCKYQNANFKMTGRTRLYPRRVKRSGRAGDVWGDELDVKVTN